MPSISAAMQAPEDNHIDCIGRILLLPLGTQQLQMGGLQSIAWKLQLGLPLTCLNSSKTLRAGFFLMSKSMNLADGLKYSVHPLR